MARPVRINIPGGCYHVTARGNERHNIYRDLRDRNRFVELFECGLKLKELAEAAGGIECGMSSALRRFESNLTRNQKLQRLLDRAVKQMINNQM